MTSTSRVFSGDLEYGRGRQQDSSSSRESSPTPGQKRKRPFSPGSDDGEPDIPPIVDDDTPPPPERPLIRQAFAFGGATPVLPSSSIYKATMPDTATQNFFLPGQAPEPPKKTATKRKKKGDPYKGQSGRFRLETYNPTPSGTPPVQQGPGPYASAFRGYSQRPLARSESPAVAEHSRYPSTSASTVRGSLSPAPAPAPAGHGERRISRSQSAGSRTKSVVPQNARRTPQIQLETPAPPIRMSSASHLPTPIADGLSPTFPPSSATSSSSSSSRPRVSHYRQDYETGQSLGHHRESSFDFPMLPPGFDADPQPPSPRPMAMSHSFPSLGAHTSSASRRSNAVVKGYQPRIITILAKDSRNEQVDHQLIEVEIPVRESDEGGGFWADARMLLEQWQSGVGRVDGPALVYTLRGKYRQILLRVSASNEDDYSSGSIVLDERRTVQVYIENLPTPNAPPPPPSQRRHDSFPNPRPANVANVKWPPHPLASNSTQTSQPTARLIETPRRRFVHSSSDDDYDEPMPDGRNARTSSPPQRPGQDVTMTDPSTPSGLGGRPVHMNILAAGPSRSQSPPSAIQTPSRSSVQHRKGYQSPCPGDEPEKVESAILKVVDNLIQKNEKDKWKVFFRLKGDPETASNMVARYRFVQDLMDKHVGKVVPFKSTADYIIEEKHILGALQIVDEDGRFASNCTETLELLKLYGKDGERSEDPEVVKLLEDQDLAYNAKPIKRLLRLLRGADEKWIQEHPAS